MATISIRPQHIPFRAKYQVLDGGDTPFKKAIKAVGNFFRSADGLDEFSSAAGQALPGIGAPLASLSILGPATPLVIIGAQGAVNDSVERFRELYPTTLQGLVERQQRILDAFESLDLPKGLLDDLKKQHAKLEKITAMYIERQSTKSLLGAMKAHDLQELKKTLKVKNPFSQPGGGAASRAFLKEAQRLMAEIQFWVKGVDVDKLSYEIIQYQQQENHRHVERIDRDFSVPGAGAMAGMAAGMFPATAESIADVVKEGVQVATGTATAGASAAAASSTLGVVAGAVFLPAQGAMAVHGFSKLATGVKRERQFKKNNEAIEHLAKSAYLDRSTAESVQQGIKRQRYYNAHHSISYGAATGVGQGFMMAGNIATLSGAGVVAAAPLLGVGVPLTIGAAVQRIVYEKKEEKFVGEGASEVAKQTAIAHDIDGLVKQHDVFQATRLVEEKYKNFQDKLVRIKLFSLVDHVLKKEEKAGHQHTTAERILRIEGMLTKGKKNIVKGTTLLKSDLELMGETYEREWRKDLHGRTTDVRKKWAEKLSTLDEVPTATGVIAEKALSKTLQALAKKAKHDGGIDHFFQSALKDKDGKISNQDIEEFAQENETARNIYQSKLNTGLVKQIKKDMKFLRYDASESLVRGAIGIQALKKEGVENT